MVDALAATHALENVILLRLSIRRDNAADVLSDHLLRCEAEEPLGARIPRQHGAVERLADNRVVRPLDDGGEAGAGLLGPAAFGDVADHQYTADSIWARADRRCPV